MDRRGFVGRMGVAALASGLLGSAAIGKRQADGNFLIETGADVDWSVRNMVTVKYRTATGGTGAVTHVDRDSVRRHGPRRVEVDYGWATSSKEADRLAQETLEDMARLPD
jgi:hypothetical protein